MSLPIQNPPLLLTKRLTTFLHANQTPQLPTLLVTSPTGKLLAHASPHPVSLLRTHATVASSLLAIHTSSSPALPHALPGSHSPDLVDDTENDDDDDDEEQDSDAADDEQDPRGRRRTEPVKPSTITVQLTGGTVLIRRLKCGLLFVCVGPAASSHHSTAPDAVAPQHLLDNGSGEHLHPPAVVSTSPRSEADSLVSAGAQTTTSLESQGATAVVAMRRHAADLARWLDDKLGALAVPDEGVGVE